MNGDSQNAQYADSPEVSVEMLLNEYRRLSRRINERNEENQRESRRRDLILAELRRRKAHA